MTIMTPEEKSALYQKYCPDGNLEEVAVKLLSPQWVEGLRRSIPGHMLNGVYRYLCFGIMPGDFMRLALSNDFYHAAGRADEENLRALAGWINAMYNFMPVGAHGGLDAVTRWCNSGGIAGMRERGELGELD